MTRQRPNKIEMATIARQLEECIAASRYKPQ